jgi:hypothetical protein
MPRPSEIRYFAAEIAGLMVTEARAQSDEQLREVHDLLEEAFIDVLMLISHDALPAAERPAFSASLPDDLLGAVATAAADTRVVERDGGLNARA